MTFIKLALAAAAAILPLGLAANDVAAKEGHGHEHAAETEAISYADALRCTALMAVFTVVFDNDEDVEAAAMFGDLLTRWSMVATTRGITAGEKPVKDIGAATKAFGKELEGVDDDEAATDRLFDDRGDRCIALQDANSDEFDAVDVDAITKAETDTDGAAT